MMMMLVRPHARRELLDHLPGELAEGECGVRPQLAQAGRKANKSSSDALGAGYEGQIQIVIVDWFQTDGNFVDTIIAKNA